MKNKIITLALILSVVTISAQSFVANKGAALIKVAKSHLGKPYLANTLDVSMEEKLIVRTDGFDCTTLVETVLAQVNAPTHISDHITKTRYIDGIINDYASRIHYFTHWIHQNAANGVVKDISASLKCSKSFDPRVSYMAEHRSQYKQLADEQIYEKIKQMEQKVDAFSWRYIPKSAVASCQQFIKDGDIIAVTSNVNGLDIAHLGFALWQKGKLHLLHASTDYKKVVISPTTLSTYLLKNKKQSGIMILRVN
jgi:hypothetical protein